MTNATDGYLLQHLHLLVGEGASRSHHDRFARMDAQRVEVLHRGYGETVVVGIANTLELNLFPAFQTLLDQNLGSKGESRFCQLDKGLLVRTNPRAQTTQRISRTNHDGESYFTGSLQSVVHILDRMGNRHLQVDLAQFLDK